MYILRLFERCLEAATGPEERRKIVACMRGRIVDLATNCNGYNVLQKALDCKELLRGDPATTLVDKDVSHVRSKITELSWTPPSPPIFAYVNKSLKGKWAAHTCYEPGSLVVQHTSENLEGNAKDGIVDELLGQDAAVFGEKHPQMALEHLLTSLLEFAASEQGSQSVVKSLKEGGKETLDRVVQRMCEPAKGYVVLPSFLSFSRLTFPILIAPVNPKADKDQRAVFYDCIGVILHGCKTGSKVIWLLDRMRAYYGY
ncbi:hypothetical protein B0H14DRAFT_3461057 [Mycena olivaceomarginata]|nr:hypothetical protein B0H14DRAFT_3461057 [Mycena olivaceomarginata]